MDLVVDVDDPRDGEVVALLAQHLAFARGLSPEDHVHALDPDALLDPAITFFTARRDGRVVGVAALRRLDAAHAELKSMHVAQAGRGQGIGRALVDHLLTVARDRGFERVSLETGTMPEFAPARRLYAAAGFQPSPPFGDYTDNPYSTCMAIELATRVAPERPRAVP